MDGQDGGAAANPNQPPGGIRPTQAGNVAGASTSSVIPPPKAEEALGAGFIFDSAGYIATNNHVIDGATTVTVTLNDGTILPATIVGQDKRGDLAVLKVDAGHKLPGLDQSSSAGIVSALHRDIGEDKYDDFIQTDATINRGNSGGPLFDINGHVIGIDSAIYSPSGGSVGIGFAIPSAMVQPVVESLKATGAIKRGWLGVSSQDVTPEIQKLLKLPTTSGALIGGIMEGGPSVDKLQPGDVLVSLNGVPITNPRSLMIRTAQILSGQTAEASFWRDGTLHQADITIAVPPPDKPPGVAPPPAVQPNIDLASIGVAISPAPSANGLTVIAVTAGGPAAKAGLVADNTISAVGAEPISSAGALRDQLNDLANSHQKVAVLLVSGDDAGGDDPGPRWVPVGITK
jgi:serine protease Do/2-alkenal reductase